MIRSHLLSLILVLSSVACAQLRIENPGKLPLPQDQAVLGYRIAREQVAHALSERLGRSTRLPEFTLTLKLSCEDPSNGDEYFSTDEVRQGKKFHNTGLICMRSWDLGKFMYGVMRISERWAIEPDRYVDLLQEAMRRVDQLASISVDGLRKQPLSFAPPEP